MDPLNAEILIDLGDGRPATTWSLQLSADAPLDPDGLLEAVAGQFLDDATELSTLALTYSGTFGSPRFRIGLRAPR